MEKVTVEEFIARLIRHIPDENFKTIRYYGVYSRRIKGLCKRLVSAWQKEARRWIVRAKRILKRRTWSERIIEKMGAEALTCSRCTGHYEYKGEVCLEDGQLKVRYAVCKTSKACLERMIIDVNKKAEEKEKGGAACKQIPSKQGDSEVYLPAV